MNRFCMQAFAFFKYKKVVQSKLLYFISLALSSQLPFIFYFHRKQNSDNKNYRDSCKCC